MYCFLSTRRVLSRGSAFSLVLTLSELEKQYSDSVHLVQCFPNCGAVGPCGQLGGPRDPLTSAHHVCCNISFVILYILIHLIILLLQF